MRIALAVGMTGDKARLREIPPDRRQILFFYAEQVDALATGDLHLRHLELVADIGDGA